MKVVTRDGRNSGLLEEKEIEVEDDNGVITRYLMTADANPADTDGASIPSIASAISHLVGMGIDPYGDYWPGAVVHDFLFRRRLLQWVGNLWVAIIYVESNPDVSKGEMDFARANAIFKALMFGLGTNAAKATIIYEALALFGRKAWDEDGRHLRQDSPPNIPAIQPS